MKEFVDSIRAVFTRDDFIALHEPRFLGNEKKYLSDCIDSTYVSSVGKYVNEVEAKFAEKSQCGRAVAVVNGTSALHMALMAVGVEDGDLVLTQALSFVATANAISYVGADPVFIDVDRESLGLSPDAVRTFLERSAEKVGERVIHKETRRRITACVPMHTFGFMVDMDPLLEVCREWNIPIVEDAAEAFGSDYKGRPAGSMGKFGTLSFNGNKVITCGGGGMILTSDDDLANQLKHLTTTAKVPHEWQYIHDQVGYNYRMPNLNAALLLAQFEQLEHFIASKRKLFSTYRELSNKFGLKLLYPPSHGEWNHWLIALELRDMKERDEFLKISNGNGVMTRPIWNLLFELPMYEHCLRDDQVNARYLADRVVNIPSNPAE